MTDLVAAQPKTPSKKKRRLFIEFWLSDPESDTFGNAYLAAKAAGFSESYARILTGNALGVQWVQEAKQQYAAALSPAHVYKGIQDIALNTRADRDKLRAYELLGKFNGMFIDRVESNVNVRFTNSVPRPVIDVTQADTPNQT